MLFDDRRISFWVDMLSMHDFHETICSDSGMAPFMNAEDGIRYRESETLSELYEKLSAAPIHAMTKDGRMVTDLFLSSRTVSGYRTGTRSIGGPMLVLVMTSFNKDLFNAVEKASDHPILMMQDPFFCTSPGESICFILFFEDDKAGQGRKKVSEKLRKRKVVRDEGTRRTNECLFMLEAYWVPLSRMRLDVEEAVGAGKGSIALPPCVLRTDAQHQVDRGTAWEPLQGDPLLPCRSHFKYLPRRSVMIIDFMRTDSSMV